MQVLTVSGKAQHGKDTLARIAADVARDEFGMTVRRFAFAWPLKARAYAVGACEGSLDWRDIVKKDPAVRKLLQEEGTEKGRMVYGDDFWVYQVEAFLNLMKESEPGIDLVILSDARFVNEVRFARERGHAVYIRSDRPTLTGAAAQHPSEIELDPYVGTRLFTAHINNDLSVGFDNLRDQIFPVLSSLAALNDLPQDAAA